MECAEVGTSHMEMCRQACLAQCTQKKEIFHLLAATAVILSRHPYSLRHTHTHI